MYMRLLVAVQFWASLEASGGELDLGEADSPKKTPRERGAESRPYMPRPNPVYWAPSAPPTAQSTSSEEAGAAASVDEEEEEEDVDPGRVMDLACKRGLKQWLKETVADENSRKNYLEWIDTFLNRVVGDVAMGMKEGPAPVPLTPLPLTFEGVRDYVQDNYRYVLPQRCSALD